MNPFAGKKVLFGIAGGIAAYKSCEVIRRLVDRGIEVQVVMTEGAQQFVTPLTFETLSRRRVLTRMFTSEEMVATRHVDLPVAADLVVVCPATANILGKAANGIADDLLSTMLMVAGPPKIVFCPAMNSRMWEHPAVQRNVAFLREAGARFVEPEVGKLAEEAVGVGRLAAPERILSKIRIELLRSEELAGQKVVVTAGPTEEALDPVRFITNASSGKMGFALAEAAVSRGADVVLVSGPTDLTPPEDVRVLRIRSALEMEEAVLNEAEDADVVIMSAAVSDYRPAAFSEQKIKKSGDIVHLQLKKNPDILAALGKRKGDKLLVGFAVETENVIANAQKKLKEKNLDLIVVNDPGVEGAAFRADTNVVTILTKNGEELAFPRLDKLVLAHAILDELLRYRRGESLSGEGVVFV